MLRYIEKSVIADLKNQKMVFIGGPRQVGKTTFSLDIGEKYFTKQFDYLNYDIPDHRKRIENRRFAFNAKLLIFDEIHKMPGWKNYLKGLYDQYKSTYSILVTGSARLDVFQKGSDSLLGRYFYYRLHPFTVAESKVTTDQLLTFGGFPEPLFTKSQTFSKRWQKQRKIRLIKEDIRDLALIKDLSKIQQLVELLPERITSRLSINSLSQALSVSHKTISSWLQILEELYYIFKITPFDTKLSRSIRKMNKIYFWDWSEISQPGPRFENLIASHLLKYVHFMEDTQGKNLKLQYLSDKDQREIDFLITEDNKPITAIEVKLTDTKLSKHLQYYQNRVAFQELVQIINTPDADFQQQGIRIVSAQKYLSKLL